MRFQMHMLRSISFWALCVTSSWALHASEVGVVDWQKTLVGVPLTGSHVTAPVFHRVGEDFGQSVILAATGNNVLAALNPTNGSVGTCPRFENDITLILDSLEILISTG